jgi:hypothetical protein
VFPSPERFPHFPKLKDKRNTQVDCTTISNNTPRIQEELSLFIYLINKGLHNECVCHAQKSHATQQRLHTLFPSYNQKLQQLFIHKYVSCKAHPWSLFFRTYWGTFSPMISMILVAYFPASSGQLLPMIQQFVEQHLFCPYDLGCPSLPLTQVLHAHLAALTASLCYVSCWVSRIPWTVLRPSFRSCQVEPMTCTSYCALLNSHLRAGCQCLRCRIRIYVQVANLCVAEFCDSPCSH